jgi:hypothetical protein
MEVLQRVGGEHAGTGGGEAVAHSGCSRSRVIDDVRVLGAPFALARGARAMSRSVRGVVPVAQFRRPRRPRRSPRRLLGLGCRADERRRTASDGEQRTRIRAPQARARGRIEALARTRTARARTSLQRDPAVTSSSNALDGAPRGGRRFHGMVRARLRGHGRSRERRAGVRGRARRRVSSPGMAAAGQMGAPGVTDQRAVGHHPLQCRKPRRGPASPPSAAKAKPPTATAPAGGGSRPARGGDRRSGRDRSRRTTLAPVAAIACRRARAAPSSDGRLLASGRARAGRVSGAARRRPGSRRRRRARQSGAVPPHAARPPSVRGPRSAVTSCTLPRRADGVVGAEPAASSCADGTAGSRQVCGRRRQHAYAWRSASGAPRSGTMR